MIRGIYTAISGLINQEAKQDVISNNLANANTTGYKKDDLITKKFDDVLIENRDKIVNGKNVRNPIGKLSMGSKIDETFINYEQGTVQATDKDTDFAIQGSGFFTVSRNNGVNDERYYSRDGHFHVNREGYLVNDMGDRLLAKDGDGEVGPINVVVDGKVAKIKCNVKGEITLNGVPKYKMYISDFRDYKSLKKAGDNLYFGQNPIESTEVIVHQSSLEKSNINVMNEMSDMMVTMRSFESNQKIIQSLDETLGKAVNEVGRV